MVNIWMKQLKNLWKSTKIDFDFIILDILDEKYRDYDYKKLSWYQNLYRIRIGWYRIIFRDDDWDIKILLIWKRWDVYKLLHKIFS